MPDYEMYEADCEKIRSENGEILQQFESWLQDSQLSKSTMNRHVSNIEFYINEFLLYSDPVEAKDGASEISSFLGDWFVRKAMWSSVAYIKSYSASLKKFYTFMCEKGHIDPDALEEMKETIKEEMPEWLENMERYDEDCEDDEYI